MTLDAASIRCQARWCYAPLPRRHPRITSLRRVVAGLCPASLGLLLLASPALASNQTAELSPVYLDANLPYEITLRTVDFGQAALPSLQSFTAATWNGKWVMLAGRTQGLHGFSSSPLANFPPAAQNKEVWVVDPLTRQAWHRSLEDASAGLPAEIVQSLSLTNQQFLERDETLYVAGGYGANVTGGFGTYDTLTAIDLPGIVTWVVDGSGTAAEHIRQIHDPLVQVTGGAMYELGGQVQLIVGQNFQGGYNPLKNGTYTNQVRSFDLIDDGVNLAISNVTATTPDDNFRRRDLNVVPVLRPDGAGGRQEGIVVLAGVFTPTGGSWTVPIEIDASGVPTMADPARADTFKQSVNVYHAAKAGLYSESSGAMHQLLFGGLSLQYLDDTTGTLATDPDFPWVNDVSSIVIDAAGNYAQHIISSFPELYDLEGNRLRFGGGAEFFPAAGLPTFDNGVIAMDQLSGETVLGYIFGGIAANAPHVQNNPGASSVASNLVFEVVYHPVPEVASLTLMCAALCLLLPCRRLR